ncbi:MAG TPA: DedA family protein [Firmicutes bacterium]|nr:DedA family protein [Bacillota bacterium]
MESLGDSIYRLIANYGYIAIFICLAIEGTGMPGPIQLVFMAAGYLIGKGQLDFGLVAVTATLGNVTGNAIGYLIGAKGGRVVIRKYGRYFRLKEEHLDAVEVWFQNYGPPAAFFARILGLPRTPTILGAGVARMSLGLFLIFSGLGDFVWSVFWTYVGVFSGIYVAEIFEILKPFEVLIVAALVVVVAVVLIIRALKYTHR